MSSVVRVFDTTLRDGEQSPGASMTTQEKLLVAEQLTRLQVDVIEAGFPAASPGDLDAVRQVAKRVRGAAVAGLTRANKKDIDAAWEALRHAEQPVIHTFISTSDIQIDHQLRKTREQALQLGVEAVRYAKSLTSDVEFSAMDATRTDIDYLCQVIEAAIQAGATVVNLPDTVGFAEPVEFANMIRTLRERVPNIHRAVISVHCHDDLGLATANTLTAVREGARQVEVTINGIGERAGNTSLEEVVMALHTRPGRFDEARTNIRTEQLVPTSRVVSAVTGMVVPPNKAIVGANAFAHEAGIHQDGFLKNPLTYEIMTPESVGWESSKLVLGKHSGRHGFAKRLGQLGFDLEPGLLEETYRRFIDLTDERKFVTEDEIVALARDVASAQVPA